MSADLFSIVLHVVDLCKLVRKAFDHSGQVECEEFLLSLQIMEGGILSVQSALQQGLVPVSKRSPLKKWAMLFATNLKEARRILETSKFSTPVHVAYFNVRIRPRLEKAFWKAESRMQMMHFVLAQPGESGRPFEETVSETRTFRQLLTGRDDSSSGRYELECGALLDDPQVGNMMEVAARQQLRCSTFATVEWWQLLVAAIYYCEKVKFETKHRERTSPSSFASHELRVEFFVDIVRILFLVRIMKGHRYFQHDRLAVDKMVEQISTIYDGWIPSSSHLISVDELIRALRIVKDVIPPLEDSPDQETPYQETIIAENLALETGNEAGVTASLNIVSINDGHGLLRVDEVTISHGLRGNMDTRVREFEIPVESSALIPYFWWENSSPHVGIRQGTKDRPFRFCKRTDLLELQNALCGITEIAGFDRNRITMVALDGSFKFLEKLGSNELGENSKPPPSLARRLTGLSAKDKSSQSKQCYKMASVKLWKVGRTPVTNQLPTPPDSLPCTPSTSSTSSTVRRNSTPARQRPDSGLFIQVATSSSHSIGQQFTTAPQSPISPRLSSLRPVSNFSGMSTNSVLSGTSISTSNVYVQDGGRAEAIDAKAPEFILLLCLQDGPQTGRQLYWMLQIERNWEVTDCCNRNRGSVDLCENFNCKSKTITFSSSYIRSQVIVTNGTPPAVSIGEDPHFIGGKEKIDVVRSVAICFNESKDKVKFYRKFIKMKKSLDDQALLSRAHFAALSELEHNHDGQ
ncbi:hypothetical protein BJ508DRAFT_174110 [Ascobolus immersus RN42]|uniref:Uncharacterized protein n=1 Tax=Ascobolus immersus RN42 TaxID=1160509 RepID=A0A3N4HZ97_ASCIM|nr:hypothetical protein BJ508DRAFT_174110 [Ascobolus immersus RN42]